MANRRRSRRGFKRRGGSRKKLRDTAPVTQYHDTRTNYLSSKKGRSHFQKKALSIYETAFQATTKPQRIEWSYTGTIASTATSVVSSVGGIYTFMGAGSPWQDLYAMSLNFPSDDLVTGSPGASQYPKQMYTNAVFKLFLTNTSQAVTYVKIHECVCRTSFDTVGTDPSTLFTPQTTYLSAATGAVGLSNFSYSLFDVPRFTQNCKIIKIREVCLQPSQSFDYMIVDSKKRIFDPAYLYATDGTAIQPRWGFPKWTKFVVIQAYTSITYNAGSPVLQNVQLSYFADRAYSVRNMPSQVTNQTRETAAN